MESSRIAQERATLLISDTTSSFTLKDNPKAFVLGIEEKQQLVNAFRDSVEELMMSTAVHQDCIIQSLTSVLESIPPQSVANEEHKLRKSILEVINRVPHTEVLRAHVLSLSRVLLNVAMNDNQENAIVAIRVILDLLRAFKPSIEEVALLLLKLFIEFYAGWERMCRLYFVDINRRMEVNQEPALDMDMKESRLSFKVIAECPITVWHLVQLYNDQIKPHVPPLIDPMIKALSFEDVPNLSPGVKQAYTDMKFAQVKTVAFLSQYVKQSVHTMQPHEQKICDGLMNLLKTCPDVVQWRRELLVSMRTLLSLDFRKTLDERLNDLKDESAIVGSSRSCFEALRHYGYSVFADLAHQTRQNLKLDQLSWIIHRSCCILSDSERPISSYNTAARLLLYLVESIHRQRFKSEGVLEESSRSLLQKILLCLVVKLNAIRKTQKPNTEIHSLLQNLLLGLRTVLFSLTAFNKPLNAPHVNQPVPTLEEQEIRLAVKIIKGGIEGLRMCIRFKNQGNLSDLLDAFVDALQVLDPKDFVEIISSKIGYIYASLNAQTELHPIVMLLLEKPKTGLYFLTIMAGYLTETKLEILADPEQEEYRFILKLFKLLFHTLLKPEIHSVMAMGDAKLTLLVNTLVKITKVCLEKTKNTAKYQGYLQLLSFLFRYLSRSRLHFAEMGLLLPSALDLFLIMLEGPDLSVPRELIIELCLLLPLELEKKYPVLPKLMKPLLLALNGTDEMVLLGIQTMDEWIDRLNPEFLEPAMASHVQEINLALWSHLKPQPGSPIGPRILQLLGKMGGRNRRFLAEPLQLDWKDNQDHGLRLILTFRPDTKFLVPLDKCISLTFQALSTKPVHFAGDPEHISYYRHQGMRFLHICLASMMHLPSLHFQWTAEHLKTMILEDVRLPQSPYLNIQRDYSIQITSQHMADKQVLTFLLASSIALCADVELKEEATRFVQNICRHFALLFQLPPATEPSPSASNSFLRAKSEEGAPTNGLKYLEPDIFIDAVIQVLTKKQTSVSKCGAQALSWFVNFLLNVNRAKNKTPRHNLSDIAESSRGGYNPSNMHRPCSMARSCLLPDVADVLTNRIVDCCFGDNWTIKSGGMFGMEVLIDQLPSTCLIKVFPQFLISLLHLMNTLPSHGMGSKAFLKDLLLKLTQKASESLVHLGSGSQMEEPMEFTQVIGTLCLTIFSLNVPEIVRENCHDCLSLLCRNCGKNLKDILDPSVNLQSKSLRKSLEECIQLKKKFNQNMLTAFAPHMEGLSRLLIYCIGQKLPSVSHLLQPILECADFAIGLCDISEDASVLRISGARSDRIYDVLVKMRESILKMLVAISSWEVFINNSEFSEAKKTLVSMVQIFFKMLISPNENLRQISKAGLQHLIEGRRISQSDCQTALKPILSRLNKFNSLDLNVLQGGAEALKMLSDWFNQTLGEKLLDHLRMWYDPESNLGFQKGWTIAEDSEIAAAILELFHLLPDPASSFLETQKIEPERMGSERIGLVVMTIELEERLGQTSPVGPVPHVLWSPYRSPLAKFLVKYKREAVNYFLAHTRMQNMSYVNRFIDIIKSDIGEPLLVETMHSTNQLMSLLRYDVGSSEASSLSQIHSMSYVHALHLIKTIAKLRPNWLPAQRDLFQILFHNWNRIDMEERSRREEMMSPAELFECKAIAKCLLRYISVHRSAVNVLVALLSVFEYSSKADFSFIKEYCTEVIPEQYSHSELHDILVYSVSHLNDQMSQGQSIFVLRFLVIPILQSSIKKGEIDKVVMIELIQVFIQKAKFPTDERDVCLEVEMLKVGRLLTIGTPSLSDDPCFRQMLRYAWNFLKSESVECKSHAFLLAACLLRRIPVKDRVILQFFVNLLKSDFAETKRELVQEALDVLVKTLVERFDSKTEPDKIPKWMEYAIKHMVGEGHKLNLLMNLWKMVIGHPDLFYEYRSQFLGRMVNTLSRLRRPPTNANSENRQMAIDMERVIVDWEVRRIKGSGEGPSNRTVSPPPLSDETFTNMKKMVVAFLAKTVFAVPPDGCKDASVKYSSGDIMSILSRALEVWPDVEFRLDFVERLIEGSTMHHQSPSLITTAGLDLVLLALQYQPMLFLNHGWHHIIVLAQKVVTIRKEDLLEKLCRAFEIVFEIEDPMAALQDALESQLLMKYLDSSSLSLQQGSVEYEISACLRILEADKTNRTGMLTRFLSSLVQLLDRHSREYHQYVQNSAQVTPFQHPIDANQVPMPSFGNHMYNVCKIIHLCGGRLHDLNANDRETFVQSMIRFLSWKGGRFPDRAVFYKVLVVVSNWLRDMIDNGESPTLSFKVLLWSMQQICRLDANGLVEPCMKKHFDGLFLSTIYDVCTAPGLNDKYGKDVFLHVEQMMLCGIRTTTPDLRKNFFQLYETSLGASLFERLRFILQTQDWEHVASRFWLKQALDYLLDFLKGDEPITFAPNSSRLVPFPSSQPERRRSISFTGGSLDAMDIDSDMDDFENLLTEHEQFLRIMSTITAENLMGSLRESAHVNAALACHLWVLIFPIVWATLGKNGGRNGQVSLAKPIISILSKPYHAVQAQHRPNVIQGLLEGISLSQPQPKIPPELIKYLGKTYNAWHIAIPLLESHVVIFPEETRCFDALAELYNLLSETDMMFGLFKKGFQSAFTHTGINLMQYGYWEEALHVFGEAAMHSAEDRVQAPAREVMLWSLEWVRCAKELNQWDELHNWAESTGNYALLADASWRQPELDWAELRRLLQTEDQQFPDRLQHSMLMIYTAFQENNITLCNAHITSAIEQCLQRWWQLPKIGILGQVHLLQKFQQVVELCESCRAFMDNPARNGRHEQSNFTKEILETWRLRSPNPWEPLSVWADVFLWRHIIYSSIANSITPSSELNSPSLHHLCVKDKAWSINKLANVARKHGALEVCIDIEFNMYNDSYMDVQEAFLKIVEQSKAYLRMENQKMMGLTMLCSTNLDYFPYQGLQAEIYRLQGEFYRALGEAEMATKAYSTSISLNHQLPEAWLCWGAFCDDTYEKTKTDPNSNSILQLEYAVGCYFQAMQLQSSAARAMIPRCLQLLSFDRSGTVQRVFKDLLRCIEAIPASYWLFYIPQILSVLHRQEGECLKMILYKLIQNHPQSLYYFLRVHMLNMKEAVYVASERNRQNRPDLSSSQTEGAPSPGSTVGGSTRDEPFSIDNSKPNLRLNFESVKDLMDKLKHQLGPLSSTLEVMLREIASNFMAKPEERLMAVVHVLLARCCKVNGAETAEIPQNLIRELDGVCRACFPDGRGGTAMHRDLKEDFVRNLSPADEDFPKTLGELTNRLKKWRNTLSQYLDEQMPKTLQLHRESPALQELNLSGIEMPCQHTKTPEVCMDTPVYLEKISSEIHTIRRQGTAFRRIAFYDSEGRKTHFILQNGHTSGQPASSEERMLQLMCLLNRLLDKHHQCRSRFLNFFAPSIVPVWNKVRLVEEDPCFTTFLEAFELNCQLCGREADFPVLNFKWRVYNGNNDPEKEKPAAFQAISEQIPDNIFSQYMYKILPSSNHLWVFKKQFCSQMALSSLMSVMLSLTGRVPGKILFSRSSGKVLQVDFYPIANQNGYVHQTDEVVPFRLTRNLAAFFTPFGVEGVFMTTMVCAAMALTQNNSNLNACLNLFFRDELLAWASRRESRSYISSNMAHLHAIVDRNATEAIANIKNLCPVVPRNLAENNWELGIVNRRVKELVEKATNKFNLCNMDPTWHPWY